MRKDKRQLLEMRNLSFEVNYTKHPEGSCLVKCGDTWVLCTASIDEKVPPFLRNKGQGWITAEYNMLPRATHERVIRDIVKGRQSGRTLEIQRLISRSLRAALNLELLGERQITIDCDVLQADGGTRTAAINGGYVALQLALRSLNKKGLIHRMPILKHVSAISCGVVKGEVMVDLNYLEDSSAEVDANFVFTSDNKFVEVQVTGEKNTFDQDSMTKMLEASRLSCMEIIQKQKAAVAIAIA